MLARVRPRASSTSRMTNARTKESQQIQHEVIVVHMNEMCAEDAVSLPRLNCRTVVGEGCADLVPTQFEDPTRRRKCTQYECSAKASRTEKQPFCNQPPHVRYLSLQRSGGKSTLCPPF